MAEINIRQIEIFLSVAKHQNISKAAAELFISQPSLSKWISKMEEDYGAPLFRRTNRGVVLTEEGEELHASLEFEYHRFRVSVEEVFSRSMRELERNTLRVGILNRLVVNQVASEQIYAYSLQHPDVQIWHERFNFHELRSKLLCEDLDVIVSLKTDIAPYPEYTYQHLCDFPAFFIVPQVWASGGIERLNGQTLIIEAPTQRPWAEEVCRAYGITPQRVKYVNSYAMLTTMVSREKGFSIDGKMVTDRPEIENITYLPIRRALCGDVVIAWRDENTPKLVKDFTSVLLNR